MWIQGYLTNGFFLQIENTYDKTVVGIKGRGFLWSSKQEDGSDDEMEEMSCGIWGWLSVSYVPVKILVLKIVMLYSIVWEKALIFPFYMAFILKHRYKKKHGLMVIRDIFLIFQANINSLKMYEMNNASVHKLFAMSTCSSDSLLFTYEMLLVPCFELGFVCLA